MPPTDLNTLAADLRARSATSSTVVLDDAVFADEKVRADIRSAFALSAGSDLTIKVKASDIPDPADGVLTISTATASVLKQTNVGAKLFFTAQGGALQAIITLELPSSWKFSQSFSGLDCFPF